MLRTKFGSLITSDRRHVLIILQSPTYPYPDTTQSNCAGLKEMLPDNPAKNDEEKN
jgi:hypothetical protein